MDINLPTLLKTLALNLVPAEKRKALEEAISKAQEAISSAGDNPLQALKNNGVSVDFLQKIKKNLNTPLANTILANTPISPEEAERQLDEIISGKPVVPATELPPPSQPRVYYGNVTTQEQKNELMNKLRRGLKNL